MFNSEDVELYLKRVSHEGGKNDETLITLRLFKTPIDYHLMKEVDEHVAAALFRKSGTEWKPVAEIDKPSLVIQPEACSMRFKLHPELKSGGGFIPLVQFDKLCVYRLFVDKLDFTLSFDANFICNDPQISWQFINRIRKTFFATFEEVQEGLPFPSAEKSTACESCNAPAELRSDDKQTYVCRDCVGAYIGQNFIELEANEQFKAKQDSAASGGRRGRMSPDEVRQLISTKTGNAGFVPPEGTAPATEEPKDQGMKPRSRKSLKAAAGVGEVKETIVPTNGKRGGKGKAGK